MMDLLPRSFRTKGTRNPELHTIEAFFNPQGDDGGNSQEMA